ncbi:MAG: hypothetical protein HC819_01510 [Cyclobacteriaceae bacterium]|nr:hypothetical protein [Cyclobacteriaceae bacterium]
MKQVEAIRKLTDKDKINKLKSTLPAITPSGEFKTRKASNLIQHSGFLQFDIDFKDNKNITNYDELKSLISRFNEVAYCGLSVSGNGYWGLVLISNPDKHKDHFKALSKAFEKFDIVIDQACSDVSRLRGYSCDIEAYFNHNATPFTALASSTKNNTNKKLYNKIYYNNFNSDQSCVKSCIDQINTNRIDITGGYAEWFAIGCSLANEFGESGRDYFHQVSQYHHDYDPHETDHQYDNCLKQYGYQISTFFYHCELYGIKYKMNLNGRKTINTNTKSEPQKPLTIEEENFSLKPEESEEDSERSSHRGEDVISGWIPPPVFIRNGVKYSIAGMDCYIVNGNLKNQISIQQALKIYKTQINGQKRKS